MIDRIILHYRIVEKLGGGMIYSYEWSPDGKRLALVRGDSPSDLVLIQNAERK